jgi:large subunit ribosomal protein L4
MSAKTLTAADAASANITLVEGRKGTQAVHDLIIAYRANRRSGTANTKTRAEVKCTGKKMYKQKGTGNARHGDRGAPIFVGGGVAFGPKPRSYAKKVSKSVRKLALRRVLTSKIAASEILTVPAFEVADAKTKSFIATVASITDAKKVLVIASSFTEQTYLAARNIKKVQLITSAEANIEQILHANTVVITEDAIEAIAKRTA